MARIVGEGNITRPISHLHRILITEIRARGYENMPKQNFKLNNW